MICFHGSYCEIKEPSIQFSRDKLDFGKGFYVTPIEAQAINWGARFKRMGKTSVVNTYEFGYEEVLINGKVLTFHEYSLEWLKYHKPNFQICIVNQDVIDKYLIFKESRDI